MKNVFVIAVLLVAACRPSAAPSAPVPAVVVAKEGDLLRLQLTAAATQRLGIVTAPVELRPLPRARSLAGEVRIPPGRTVVLTAPLAGTLGGTPPAAGTALAAAQTILTLTPLLSAESRATFAAMQVDAEGLLAAAVVQRDATELARQRAERLQRDGAGSQRGVEEAVAARDAAAASTQAAQARKELLASAVAGTLGTVPVVAPFAGVLRQLNVAPGQQVAAGAPLCEVADLGVLWIRVPVFVGELPELDVASEVRIEGLPAQPVLAPPAADPLTATADVVYTVPDPRGTLRPGQRVVVSIPRRGDASPVLAVPWSAVHHDSHGGTWVYEQVAPQTFVRRRVQVRNVVAGVAAIDSALPPGALVVTTGVPELFGIEFGHAR